jgi:hypothetical protein
MEAHIERREALGGKKSQMTQSLFSSWRWKWKAQSFGLYYIDTVTCCHKAHFSLIKWSCSLLGADYYINNWRSPKVRIKRRKCWLCPFPLATGSRGRDTNWLNTNENHLCRLQSLCFDPSIHKGWFQVMHLNKGICSHGGPRKSVFSWWISTRSSSELTLLTDNPWLYYETGSLFKCPSFHCRSAPSYLRIVPYNILFLMSWVTQFYDSFSPVLWDTSQAYVQKLISIKLFTLFHSLRVLWSK